ncbi:MAG TPA: secretin N-terminal domain-containing protein [Blastocatellia bacterium]|nr:secretin N-terminal domain-containing protein [Blastocatellia bacterium]
MAKTRRIQQALALAVALTMALPIVAFAADGKKHFKDGLKYEENRQWDKAAQEFALAVAEKPSNVEYQLHLQRALLSASIMLTERGDTLADKKDYNAAYNAYRQAFSFDPSNELALIKMRRMLEAQGLPTNDLPSPGDPSGPKYKSASNTPGGTGVTPVKLGMRVQFPAIPGRRFAKTDVVYRDTNILTAIEQLAQMMKLNVIFDQQVNNQMRALKITVELRDVTYPNALEWILKTNNLMYAQIGPRTIVVGGDNPQQRSKYEPFAVRTFYVKNASVDDAKTAITGALQTKAITTVKQLNALIIRDTPSNLELIENLINSIDKSKAEVLIDVNIYEVTRDDLLKIGNQFNIPGSSQDPANTPPLGGIGLEQAVLGKFPRTLTGPFALALGLPTSTLSFFQDKGKAKLLASTQVHVIDNEANAVRIGQRVPIQTASFFPSGFVNTTGTQNNNQQPNNLNSQFVGGGFGGGAFPQIQYENVGLNIDVTPNVFEDEVQMKMKIESSSVDNPSSLTPIFSQRTMSSVARIKDGQTALIAGVSQNTEAKSVRGLPLIGLIPILGRFFATPSTTNRQSDVIITVTPHILRRADITEQDHLARAAGDQQNPTNQLHIDQILYIADQEDAQQNQVAEVGGTPAAPEAKVQPVASPPPGVNQRTESPGVVVVAPPTAQPQPVKPNIIKTTVSKPGVPAGNAAANPQQQSNQVNKVLDDDDDDDDDEPADSKPQSPVVVYVRPTSPSATRGQDFYVAIFVNGNGDVSSAHISMSYDGSLLEVKGVRDSGMMSAGARAELNFSADSGQLNIQMDRPQGTPGVPARGQLCLVVFTVKGQGQSPLVINEQQTQFRNSSGQALPITVHSSQVDVR